MSAPTSKRSLPAHPSLVQYRKQAKDLVRALDAHDPDAKVRVTSHHPRYASSLPQLISLGDAHLVIAREHGCKTWTEFRAKIESSPIDIAARITQITDLVLNGQAGLAVALLAEEPSLASADIYIASLVGNTDAVRRFVEQKPELVNAAGGPRKRPPLLYASFSHLIRHSDYRQKMVDTINLLLESGADSCAKYSEEPWKEYPFSALYGVAGRFGDLELATILLDAGANPNDGESLYHAMDHLDGQGIEIAKLLLDRGGKCIGTNALNHALDFDNIDAIRLLLDRGADVNEFLSRGNSALHHALQRNRSVEIVELLIDAGANVNQVLAGGLTPYRYAVRRGNTELMASLEKRGIGTESTEIDQFMAACWAGNSNVARRFMADNPNVLDALSAADGKTIVDAASEGNADAVRVFLECGFDIHARGLHNATSLHWASWNAYPEIVELLLSYGATVDIEGASLGSTPLQWAFYGTTNNGDADPSGFVPVIKLLIESGAKTWDKMMEFASEQVRSEITKLLKTRALSA